MDKSDQIFQTLDKIRNLPTLPVVVQQLRKAVADPNSDASRIAKLIQDDPSMMARILKVVNSVLYGASVPINSLQMAVSRMGLNAVNNIAMSTSVFSTFSKAQQTDFNREDFWRHCYRKEFGGEDKGNKGKIKTKAVPMHNLENSISLDLPPMSTIYLKKTR